MLAYAMCPKKEPADLEDPVTGSEGRTRQEIPPQALLAWVRGADRDAVGEPGDGRLVEFGDAGVGIGSHAPTVAPRPSENPLPAPARRSMKRSIGRSTLSTSPNQGQ